jgi:hypothetical protein
MSETRVRRLPAAVIMVGAAFAATVTGLVTPAAASAAEVPDTVVDQPFAADSGDACPLGRTKGVLGWHLRPLGGGPTAVDVTGILLDQPLSGDVSIPECADDGRFSTVTFTALAGGTVVDTGSGRVDNGTVRLAFRLAAEVRAIPIDQVVVQVCRVNLDPAPFEYCGPKQVYRAPIAISS